MEIILNTDANGYVTSSRIVNYHDIYVNVDEIIPKGMGKGRAAFIIEKMDVAICDGKDTWYAGSAGNVRSAKAGQPWSALFG